MQQPGTPTFHIVEEGHVYDLHSVEGGAERLGFIKKEADPQNPTGPLVTIKNGTTNEAVLDVLMDRLTFLNGNMQSAWNAMALHHLEEARKALEERTKERKERGVEGTHQS